MKEDKSTPAVVKKDGKKTVYTCGKNAKNKPVKGVEDVTKK